MEDDELDLFEDVSSGVQSVGDSDDIFDDVSSTVIDEHHSTDDELYTDTDIISELLRDKGIVDTNRIKFINESGEYEEVSFDDLSIDEQLQILRTQPPSSETDLDLDEDEINVVNYLRTNNLTLDDFVQAIKNEAYQEMEHQSLATIDIADISDDVIFITELQAQYPDLTEEELETELEKEKLNGALFNKKVNIIRQRYEEAQQQEQAVQRQAIINQQQAEYQHLENSLVQSAISIEDIHNFDLNDDDKNEILDFILTKDVNNRSQFAKMLDDPKELFKLGWYMKYGDAAFKELETYYTQQIANSRRSDKTQQKQTTRSSSKSRRKVDPDELELFG